MNLPTTKSCLWRDPETKQSHPTKRRHQKPHQKRATKKIPMPKKAAARNIWRQIILLRRQIIGSMDNRRHPLHHHDGCGHIPPRWFKNGFRRDNTMDTLCQWQNRCCIQLNKTAFVVKTTESVSFESTGRHPLHHCDEYSHKPCWQHNAIHCNDTTDALHWQQDRFCLSNWWIGISCWSNWNRVHQNDRTAFVSSSQWIQRQKATKQ